MITLNYVNGFYSVVLLGRFNPLIFHPLWLLKKRLIPESDVVNKQIVINSQVSQYPIGDWMQMTVTPDRCEFNLGDAGSFYKFGSKLAILDIWKDCLHTPRLRDIIIEDVEKTVEGEEIVRRRIQIKSAEIKDQQFCIDVNLNNHYTAKVQDTAFAIKTLDTYLMSDMEKYEEILSSITRKMNSDE